MNGSDPSEARSPGVVNPWVLRFVIGADKRRPPLTRFVIGWETFVAKQNGKSRAELLGGLKLLRYLGRRERVIDAITAIAQLLNLHEGIGTAFLLGNDDVDVGLALVAHGYLHLRARDWMLADQFANFTFHPALSAPSAEDQWTGHLGFIHEVVMEKYLRDHGNPLAVEYYLCGPPMMIKACAKMLTDIGVPIHQIAYDEF